MKLYMTFNVSFLVPLDDLYPELRQRNISDNYVRTFLSGRFSYDGFG